MKKLLFILIFLSGSHFLVGQNQINYYEYWFDGNYTDRITQSVDPVAEYELNDGISTALLENGIHTFQIRFRDDNLYFSSVISQYFYKYSTDELSSDSIIAYEYWFDDNYADRIQEDIAPQTVFNLNDSLMNSITVGMHNFRIRFFDGTSWSNLISQFFFKSSEGFEGPNLIAGYRYWFDEIDSSIVEIELPAPVNPKFLVTEINATVADTGYHRVFFQFRDLKGYWSNTIIDTFYNYGTPNLTSITPNSGGNIGEVTANIYGNGFFDGTTVMLVNPGVDTVFVPDSMMLIMDNKKRIVCTFDLREKILGFYDVVVNIVVSDTILNLVNGFEIVEGVEGDIEINLISPTQIRSNIPYILTVNIFNTSNYDVFSPLISISSVDDNYFSKNLPNLEENYKSIPLVYTDEFSKLRVHANSCVQIPIYSKTIEGPGSTTFSLMKLNETQVQSIVDSSTLTLLGEELVVDECDFTGIEIIDDFLELLWEGECSCVPEYLNTFAPDVFSDACAEHDACYHTCNSIRSRCDDNFYYAMIQQCNEYFECGTTNYRECLDYVLVYFGGIVKTGQKAFDSAQILEGCNPQGPTNLTPIISSEPECNVCEEYTFSAFCYMQPIAGSLDPNNKLGLFGFGSNNYIIDNQPYPYLINFENDTSATAPAQTVKVIDTLDADVFDFNTFQLGFVSFGDTLINLPPNQQHYQVYIDLRPDNNIVVKLNADFNDTTGIAQWLFQSLNPSTYLPVTDPLAGFLPPNITSPEGQGSVFYSVSLLDSLENGTIISNEATIIFDLNDPITTDPWINTLDNVKPISNVAELPYYTPTDLFTVNWNGTDEGSQIENYDIYYAINDGEYHPWLVNTSLTSAEFFGVYDSTYTFYSVAKDTAGNVESIPEIFDAKTTLVNCGVYSLNLSFENDTTICEGVILELSVDGGEGYEWSNGEITPTILIDTSGVYFVTGNAADGTCFLSSDTIFVSIIPLPDIPVISADGVLIFCEGDSVELISSEFGGNVWSTGDTSNTIFVSSSGNYTVSVSNGCGVSVSAETSVLVYPEPTSPNITSSNDTLFAPVGYNYQWFFDEMLIPDAIEYYYIPGEEGYYFVQIVDTNGCIANSDTLYFVPLPIGELDYLDNSLEINPNPNDGNYSLIYKSQCNSDLAISIYNSIGEILVSEIEKKPNRVFNKTYNLSHFKKGNYLIKVVCEADVRIKKIVIL